MRLLVAVHKYFMRPAKDLKSLGDWAIVTGATDGIGKAYAFELASKGLDVILVSRTQEKLNKVAEEIKQKFPKRKTETFAVDFGNFDRALQTEMSKTLEKLAGNGGTIGVLINNVGMSYDFPDYTLEVKQDKVDQLWDLNMGSVTKMVQIVLPIMENQQRGAIVNISSVASIYGYPLLSYYGATKAYIDTFSKALNTEYGPRGISIQVQNPSLVVSKLSKIKRSSLTIPNAEAYAKAGVRAIGYEAQISPYWAHALQDYLISWFPQSFVEKKILGMHLGIRKRALRKREKLQSRKEE